MTYIFVNKDRHILVLKFKKRDGIAATTRDGVERSRLFEIPMQLVKKADPGAAEAQSKWESEGATPGALCIRTIGSTLYNIRSDPARTVTIHLREPFEGVKKCVVQVTEENTPEEEVRDVEKEIAEYLEKHPLPEPQNPCVTFFSAFCMPAPAKEKPSKKKEKESAR
eukprot:tig00021489_g21693.t1